MNVRIPFKISAKGMKNHDKTGSEILAFIYSAEHKRDNAGNSVKQAVKERTIFKKEVAKILINSENTVSVVDVDKLKGHVGSALHRIFVTTSGAEATFTAEGDKFKLSAFGAAIHSTAKRGITAMDHFFYIFNDRVTGVKTIDHFFIMV